MRTDIFWGNDMEKLEELFIGNIVPRTERIYAGIREGSKTEDALAALDELMGMADSFGEFVRKNDLDPDIKTAMLKHTPHIAELEAKIRRFLEDAKTSAYSETYADQVRSYVSNLHLLMNNMQDLSREIDRHYEKKPHLMVLDIPSCTGCAGGTCSAGGDKGEEKKDSPSP